MIAQRFQVGQEIVVSFQRKKLPITFSSAALIYKHKSENYSTNHLSQQIRKVHTLSVVDEI